MFIAAFRFHIDASRDTRQLNSYLSIFRMLVIIGHATTPPHGIDIALISFSFTFIFYAYSNISRDTDIL